MPTEVMDTEVLVVGGGAAGCRAAIEAHDLGARVTMIVKGRLGHSGCTYNVGTSAAVGPCGDPEDTTYSAMVDLLAHGGYLGVQDLAKVLVEESPHRVIELERWGIDFDRKSDGTIATHWSAAHTRTRNLAFKTDPDVKFDYGLASGCAMMHVLITQVRKRDIRVLDDVALVDLVVNDGVALGAVTLDCRRGELVAVEASATVMATGTYSQIFAPTTVDRFETGDGQAAAYRAGAELIDMESTQFVSTSVGFPPGSRFLNALKEPFLERYGIDNPRTVTKEELCYAIGMEIRAGRATERESIYLDLTDPLSGVVEPNLLRHINEFVDKKRGQGQHVDPWSELVESDPQAHTTIGGIRINARCETNLPGLFAAGGGAGGVYGHARPEGYTSMIAVVFGRRAGQYAFEHSRAARSTVVTSAAAGAIVDRAQALVAIEGADPEALKDDLRGEMRRHAWVFTDERGLQSGLTAVQRIAASYTTLQAADGFGGQSALEVPNLLVTAELMLRCSIERRESRGAFFRTDCPNTDDERWMCNIVVRQMDGEMAMEKVPVDLKYCAPPSNREPVRLHVGRGG